MFLNDYMKKRLKRLDKIASEQPKRSAEEALADYDRLKELADQFRQKPATINTKHAQKK